MAGGGAGGGGLGGERESCGLVQFGEMQVLQKHPGAGSSELPRRDEIGNRPNVAQGVLNRSSRDGNSRTTRQAFDFYGPLSFRVFDRLSFIDHEQVPWHIP